MQMIKKYKSTILFLVTLAMVLSTPSFVDRSQAYDLDSWVLWPASPYTNEVFEKYTVPYPPLSFTIVGKDRDFLSWVITKENTDYGNQESWGGELYLSNLGLDSPDVVSSDKAKPFFMGNKNALVSIGSGKTFSTVTSDDFTKYILPQYDSQMALAYYYEITGDPSSCDIANQYVPDTWMDSWKTWVSGKTDKGPGGSYPICDSGHAAPILNWLDNYWVQSMKGFPAFKSYMSEYIYGNNTTGSENWGDAVLYLPSNEGWIHMISTNTSSGGDYFESRFTGMPTPAMQFSPYHQYYLEKNGYYPRMTTLDGMINIADIESSSETWRRVLYGTTGMGNALVSKNDVSSGEGDIWDKELSAHLGDSVNVTEISGDVPAISDGHSFGLYAVTVAEKTTNVKPSAPELLWSVSNAYWQKNGSVEGKMIINGTAYSRYNVPSGYSGYKNLKLSLTRPTVGYLEDENGQREWRELMVGVDSGDNFNIYNIDANTGELINSPISLGHSLNYGDATSYWDTDYEAGFPTRIASVAHNLDDVTGGSEKLDLQNTPALNEVYVHLSNGNLYVWDPQEDDSPKLLMNMYYQLDLKGDLGNSYLGAASMQDMDATYMKTSINNDIDADTYHRFLALVVKGGENKVDSKFEDIRILLVLDITNIRKYVEDSTTNEPLVLDPLALGRGNATVILPLLKNGDYRYGWQMYLAGSEAATDKYWNEDIAISSPIFYNKRLVIASYQPDNEQSHIYVLPITKEDMDYLSTKNIDPNNINSETYLVDLGTEEGGAYKLQEGGTILTFEGIEFTGGAAIDEKGNVSVGTADGNVMTQPISNLIDYNPVSDSEGYEGDGDIIYWKIIE